MKHNDQFSFVRGNAIRRRVNFLVNLMKSDEQARGDLIMEDVKDVLPINALAGRSVLSLSTGNRLGDIRDVYIDPVSGVVLRLSMVAPDGSLAELNYSEIYSFGQDAIMANVEHSLRSPGPEGFAQGRNAKDLLGTKLITESGNILGHIANIFVTLSPPPFVLYEIQTSLIDKLLGRGFFIPASAGHALSDDGERLVVPDETASNASTDIADIVNNPLLIRTFEPSNDADDKTWVVPLDEDDDKTVLRIKNDEDETILRP